MSEEDLLVEALRDDLREAKQRIEELEAMNAWREDWAIRRQENGGWVVMHKPSNSGAAVWGNDTTARVIPGQILAMLCESIAGVDSLLCPTNPVLG